jgi:Sugar (and other) transporter
MHIVFLVGILFAYCLGAFLKYKTFQWICLVLPFVFIASFIFMPESPYYLILRDKKEKAFESLKFLRSNQDDVCSEFRKIEEFVENSAKNGNNLLNIFKRSANQRGK